MAWTLVGDLTGPPGAGLDPTPVVLTATGGVITPDAAAGSVFRHEASADVTLAEPTGGVDGQEIAVAVLASGGARTLTVAGAGSVSIPAGRWWVGELRYDATTTTWLLDDTAQGPAGSTGPQGPQGLAGADGQDGATGPVGPEGPQGPPGADGADGAPGAEGPQGPEGPPGADGQDGADGAPGGDGAQGPAGADGQDGAEGPQGPAGTMPLVTINEQTAAYDLVLVDAGRAVQVTSATGVSVTVPPASSVAWPTGAIVPVAQMGAGAVTLASGAGVTIRTAASLTTRAQYSEVSLRYLGSDTWLAAGDLT